MTSPTAERDVPASLDEVVSAVADERRRAVLRVLNHADGGAVDIETLAERVADLTDSNGQTEEEHRYFTRLTLHQIHLPKLAANGLIHYDAEAKQARSITGELSQELLSVLEPYESK
jgi:hypothetical protein